MSVTFQICAEGGPRHPPTHCPTHCVVSVVGRNVFGYFETVDGFLHSFSAQAEDLTHLELVAYA